MKSKIGSTMLGVAVLFVCAGFGIADDGGLMAFDKVYKNPQAALKSINVTISVTKPQDFSKGQATFLPSMKEFLKDIPGEDRLEFLNSLVLKNGHIVSAYIGPLEKTASEERVNEILDAIFINRRADKKLSFENAGAPARYIEMSALLKDIPSAVGNEFLDNMTFKDGGFASAYIGGLRKSLTDEKLKEVLHSLTTDPNTTPKTDDPKALCGDGTCKYSICTLIGNGSGMARCKSTDADWTCDSSCK
ncbi:MAG: hypothetical protein WCK75_11945 [Elusimicrobiota bacterium]